MKNIFIFDLNRADFVTLSGVLTSSFSVGFALSGHLYLATSILFIAMLGDAMDGILARKWGLVRDFGRYLDGFMDVLIYLVSPSIIIYLSGFDGLYTLFIFSLIIFGSIRLSVFNQVGNIEESDGLSYLGMPVFWSIPILATFQIVLLIDQQIANYSLAILMALFSVAMVVKKPFFKFKSLTQILSITIGGALIFFLIHLLRL